MIKTEVAALLDHLVGVWSILCAFTVTSLPTSDPEIKLPKTLGSIISASAIMLKKQV